MHAHPKYVVFRTHMLMTRATKIILFLVAFAALSAGVIYWLMRPPASTTATDAFTTDTASIDAELESIDEESAAIDAMLQ